VVPSAVSPVTYVLTELLCICKFLSLRSASATNNILWTRMILTFQCLWIRIVSLHAFPEQKVDDRVPGSSVSSRHPRAIDIDQITRQSPLKWNVANLHRIFKSSFGFG
jgi:hypothetical protein